MSLTFVVGAASDVFSADLAAAIDDALRSRFAFAATAAGEPYRSEEVDGRGWPALQKRVPQLAGIDAYQAAFLPAPLTCVEELLLPNVADPFHLCSLDALMDALQQFAVSASLPTDDVELMQLAAHYLEDDALFEKDLDVQLYVQLMLSAKQAVARKLPLWIVA